jgi:hypothetical protein
MRFEKADDEAVAAAPLKKRGPEPEAKQLGFHLLASRTNLL